MSDKKPPPSYAAYQQGLQREAWYRACEVMDEVRMLETPETFHDGPQPGSLAWRLGDVMQEWSTLARNAADNSNAHLSMYFDRFLLMKEQEREIAELRDIVKRIEDLAVELEETMVGRTLVPELRKRLVVPDEEPV